MWIHVKKRAKQIYFYFKKLPRETSLLLFFGFLFFLLLSRLFFLQIVQGKTYSDDLLDQHFTRSSLEADRWNIFVTDKSGENIKLTENVELYTVFIDPRYILDKENVIEELVPIMYEHLCEFNGLDDPTQLQCLQNLEEFTRRTILPKQDIVFYTEDAEVGTEADEDISLQVIENTAAYEEELALILEEYNKEFILEEIYDSLYDKIQIWVKEFNYVGQYGEKSELIEKLQELDLPYVSIVDNAFIYIEPDKVSNKSSAARTLATVFDLFELGIDEQYIKSRLVAPQENKYVELVSWVNITLVGRLFDIKAKYREQRNELIQKKRRLRRLRNISQDGGTLTAKEQEEFESLLPVQDQIVTDYPEFHGLGTSTNYKRYYPFDSFMSHVVWYLDNQGEAYYGVEEYFDQLLSWRDGKILWVATPWIGQIWSNNIEVEQPINGSDVYLTVDPIIQKELETIVKDYYRFLQADSIAVTVLDPVTGKVKSLVNYPTYNPNSYADSYELIPLTAEKKYLVEDQTYVDVPLFYLDWSDLIEAKWEARTDLALEKYHFENMLWPQVFVDKNISYPYEPGSVFKSLALAIWIDSDSFGLYDYYNDPGSVKVWTFTIANISNACTWNHSYLHALEYSCNVWMVRMAQKMFKYVFYSYLSKLGFWKKTWIELAYEDGGYVPDFNIVSKSGFFTNTYGIGLLATPLQVAAAYAPLVNWGWYVKPTVVEAVYSNEKKRFIDLAETKKTKVLKTTTSEDMKQALVSVVKNGNLKEEIYFPGLSVGWKTGTSEIIFEGVHKQWRWRTNWSFVWVTTSEDPKYIIAIQVRRPRSSERWLDTAGRLFYRIAEFLISYEQVEY